MYGTNLNQAGPNWAKLDQLGQVGHHFAVFRLLRKALLTKLDQVGPALFPTVFRELPSYAFFSARKSSHFLQILVGDFRTNCTEELENWKKGGGNSQNPVETVPPNFSNASCQLEILLLTLLCFFPKHQTSASVSS